MSGRVLHHVALGARDVERVVAFYRDVLGFTEQQRHFRDDGSLRSVWLDLGAGAALMVEHTDEAPHRVWGVGAGPFLIAVRVDQAERARLEAALEAAGAPVEGRTDHTSYARDPEGNRVAISHHPLMGRG
ncbi:MAG: VOC family protein [Deltaproteobacteria bacterium]|nr:VOC family protein [Deltaproteobacteria bacterium]